MQSTDAANAARVVALEGLEGVGRVTTRRVLEQFPDFDELANFPREQALHRLKGIPKAAKLVDTLKDPDRINAELAATQKRIDAWSGRAIRILTFLDADWPHRIDELPNPHRPNALFEYGSSELLDTPNVAFVADNALTEEPFETAQKLVKFLLERGIRVGCGISTGFDVVAIKLALAQELPPQIVASSGLARVERRMRPHASKVVKAGGLMVSSFPMDHGPFEHDVREASLVQAALAKATVFVDLRPGSFQWDAMEWALTSGSSVFSIGGDKLPERVHPVRDSVDLEWVAAAVEHVGSSG